VLLERQPISIAAAASLLSVQRAYLYRLIERINRIIGDPPPQWRHRKGIVLPVEVRRLVRAYRIFHDSRDDLVRFPRVSAGSRASLLLSLYLARTGYKAGRLMVVRSRNAVEALQQESVDAALLHESSVQSLPNELEFRRLLHWTSVEVRPRAQPGEGYVTLAWEPGSLGALLNARGVAGNAGRTIFHATSFSQALEMTKRGIVDRLILPDIYLSASDKRDLATLPPSAPYDDHLVVVFRREDGGRLHWMLDVEKWKAHID
jgi:hypothetical protein